MPLRIGHWVRGWRLDKFFKKLFNNISDEAKRLLPLVISITNEVKQVIESPIPDILVKLTPGTWDDHLLEKLRAFVPKFIIQLDIANVTAHIEDPFERANAILKLLKFSDEEMKNDFYHQFSYRLLDYLADGNLTRTEVIALAQMYYEYEQKQAA